MNKQRPGVQRAINYLDSLISPETGIAKLESIRQMASKAGVSFVTMWKALKLFQEDGKGDRAEIRQVTGHDEDSSEKEVLQETSTPGSWRWVADRFYKDILSGRYRAGEKLPTCKELQQHYGVSFATLKKVLTYLVDEQVVEPRTGGYSIPRLTSSAGHARIVAIGCGWEDGKIWVDHQDKNYFRTLESECLRSNIKLDVIVYYRDRERIRFVHTASKKDYDLTDRRIIGYIFIVANLESTPEEVLGRLVAIRRTVAVLDVVGGWKIPRYAQGNRMVQFFTATASELPAKRVAHYLLEQGHRHIAFFSPFHRAIWSRRRLDTLIDMYTKAGCAKNVRPFVYDTYAYQWDYLKNQEHNEDIHSLINQYAEWKKEAHGEFFKRFGNLGYSIVKYISEWNCASGEIYEKMRPLFDEALRDKAISAWVMANDFAATIAIDFLKEHNVRIPEELSIVSFDNTLDAMEYQLTSYDFNIHGIISMMLRFVLAPHTVKPARKTGSCLEVDGTLVVRRSTGRVVDDAVAVVQ
ncbi:MAG: substrate-binding domain-containing protein [Chitinispirillaceae bacterium]|nr:substrate-binding domain-containing protein [Chitinispirillaceae bacterium]